jgi:integrase
VQRVRGEKDPETGRRKGQLVEKRLKTEASKATLPVPPTVIEALKLYREAQAAEREQAKVWADPGLVFTTTIGTALEPRNVNRAWDEVCKRAGIGRRVRIHDLRHAAGSYLFAAGAEMKTIQKTLRHTRMATTADIYVHTFEESQRAAAEAMDGVLVDLTKKRREKRAG